MLFVCTWCRVDPGSGVWSEAPSTEARRINRSIVPEFQRNGNCTIFSGHRSTSMENSIHYANALQCWCAELFWNQKYFVDLFSWLDKFLDLSYKLLMILLTFLKTFVILFIIFWLVWPFCWPFWKLSWHKGNYKRLKEEFCEINWEYELEYLDASDSFDRFKDILVAQVLS